MDPSEDVFDSVTWESPPSNTYDDDNEDHPTASSSSRPGFRQEGGELPNSDEPKWEGYLHIMVQDPVKELEGTKDTYISYLVTGQVRVPQAPTNVLTNKYPHPDESSNILHRHAVRSTPLPRLCIPP